MTNSTCYAQAVKEIEDRISQRMDNRLMELVTTLQETLTLSMKDTMQELLTQSFGEGTHGLSNDNMSRGPQTGSSYVCGTRLAHIDSPIFNGENVNQWIHQCENYFLIDNTPDEFKVKLVIVHLEGKALQ